MASLIYNMAAARFLQIGLLQLLVLTSAISLHPTVSDVNITTIYLVSSCHLDVGFADTSAKIVNRYFDEFFPAAIQLAAKLRQGGFQQLVFTTHTFLVSLFLDCPPSMNIHCPSNSERDAFLKAVRQGYISWHAYPFNAQPEVYDQSLAEFGFQLTHDLDDQLNRNRTMTMSQRDVPGLTRAMIPIMAKHGVEALTVGVNGASMPPAVPSAFVWKDTTSDKEILAMWHPHGYGGSLGVGLQSMVIVPGMPYALAFAIRGDNTGPPSEREVFENYAKLHELFPQANVVASDYEEFVRHLKDYKHLLPVYTEEIGDTWIHGTASDPPKTAQFRTIQRARTQCMYDGQCKLSDNRFYNFSRLLLKYGEHTWGKDVKLYLHDFTNWTNDLFHPIMNYPNYQAMVYSWFEQRNWALNYSLQALKDHPLASEINRQLGNLRFSGDIDINGFELGCMKIMNGEWEFGAFKFAFDSGGLHITKLTDSRGKLSYEYAGINNPLAQLVYETFTGDDFVKFLNQYLIYPTAIYAYLDFGKLGLNNTKHLHLSPSRRSCWHKVDNERSPPVLTLLQEGWFLDSTVVSDYGGPERVWLQLDIPDIRDPAAEVPINITLYLVNKTATRIPESISLYFHPNQVNPSSMAVSKLGKLVNVSDVMKNGSKHVHSSDNGIRYLVAPRLAFKSWDTGVVSIGGTNVFPIPMATPDPSQGFAFNLFNTIWGTNYIMWWPYSDSERSSMFRYTMILPPHPTS